MQSHAVGPFTVTNPERLKLILRTFACLDEIRWSDSPDYNLINYCSEELSADEKLLTHWLSYITDRQMPFMRVWEIGGHVLSHLVRAFERSDRDVGSLAREYVQRRDTGTSSIVLQCPKEGPNRRLELQGITKGPVRFASRYVPEDTFLIFRTLTLLEKISDRRFGRFLSLFMSDNLTASQSIGCLAVALEGLTYSARARVSADNLDQKLQELPRSVSRDAEGIRADPSRWLESKRPSFPPFARKRLWAALRDYLKSPEFNPHFVQAVTEGGVPMAHRWQLENQELRQSLDQLELPGDVWNNNQVFANGLFMPHVENKRKTWDMPRTVREVYKLLVDDLRGSFYPEQLDVTFDFVPRMCERQMCHVCLFGGGVGRLCHGQADLLCPVSLVACGYDHTCDPDRCNFRADVAKEVCQHWQTLVAEARS